MLTLTIRVTHNVYKLDDGSEQVVDKHDVVFGFNISGMSWVSFSEAVVEHIKMGIGQEVRLFALDTVESTVDLVLNGQQLNSHFISNHWDFEAKKSFLLAEVVTLEAPNAKRAPKQPAAPVPRASQNPNPMRSKGRRTTFQKQSIALAPTLGMSQAKIFT